MDLSSASKSYTNGSNYVNNLASKYGMAPPTAQGLSDGSGDFLPFTMPTPSPPPSMGSSYTIDPTGGGQPQMDPSTIAAGYGRKTAQIQRPNIYAPPGGYQAGLVPGGY